MDKGTEKSGQVTIVPIIVICVCIALCAAACFFGIYASPAGEADTSVAEAADARVSARPPVRYI